MLNHYNVEDLSCEFETPQAYLDLILERLAHRDELNKIHLDRTESSAFYGMLAEVSVFLNHVYESFYGEKANIGPISFIESKGRDMSDNYTKIKHNHPDSILFFNLGNTHEIYHEDAELVARLLKLGPTQSTMWNKRMISILSLPSETLSTHINHLIKYGHKVAICEQKQARDIDCDK